MESKTDKSEIDEAANIANDLRCLDEIIRHIQNVQENCIVLGRRLMERGETFLGRTLIQNGFKHDASKFIGSEWDYMKSTNIKKMTKEQKLGLKISISDHNRSNEHHPEYWGHIKNVRDVFLAEMVCDWKARSGEFGTSLYDWVNEEAMKRFEFKKDDEVYKKIKYFIEILCNKTFEEIK